MKEEKRATWTSTRINVTEVRIVIRLLEKVSKPTRDESRLLGRLTDHVEALGLPKLGRPPGSPRREEAAQLSTAAHRKGETE